jgi:hypothetical protein
MLLCQPKSGNSYDYRPSCQPIAEATMDHEAVVRRIAATGGKTKGKTVDG